MKNYFDLILTERYWSWSVVGILYLVISLFIRQTLFGKLISETKQIDSSLYASAKGFYLKNCWVGWVLFFLSFLLIAAAWLTWRGPLRVTDSLLLVCLLVPSLFLLSVIFHLRTFASGLLSILRQRMGIEKEF